jgi:hypothetical protein
MTQADDAAAGRSRGPDRPTPAERGDPGAHDRGGWLTLDEAARRFGVAPGRLRQALDAGQIAGRRIAGEGLSPAGASPEAVVPQGAEAHAASPADDWLVQPEQVQHLLLEDPAPAPAAPDPA